MTIFQDIRRGRLPALLSVDEVYALTEAGVLAENEDIEFIRGEIVPMPAAKADWHSITMSRLMRAIIPQLAGDARLYAGASVTLSSDTLVEPDLAVWDRHILPRQVRGPELIWVIEVADSSVGYDLKVKAPLYAAFGVRDYWVVDAVRQTIRVHRAPGPNGYAEVEEYEAHEDVDALLLAGVRIRLDMLD